MPLVILFFCYIQNIRLKCTTNSNQNSEKLLREIILEQVKSKPENCSRITETLKFSNQTNECDSNSLNTTSTKTTAAASNDDKLFGLYVARSFVGLSEEQKIALKKSIRRCINDAHANSNKKIAVIDLDDDDTTDSEMETTEQIIEEYLDSDFSDGDDDY